jgi:hypothetical protein
MGAMSDSEALQMMRRASDEIKGQRATIAKLQPKAEAYDAICAILGLLPGPSRGYTEDVAFLLDRRIEEIKKAEVAAAEQENA